MRCLDQFRETDSRNHSARDRPSTPYGGESVISLLAAASYRRLLAGSQWQIGCRMILGSIDRTIFNRCTAPTEGSLRIVPYIHIREVPDFLEYNPREIIYFLRNARDEMSRIAVQDDRAHYDYVPTQIVTEYLRYKQLSDGRLVEGIKYPSSVSRQYSSAVLFATRDHVLGTFRLSN